MTLYSMSCRRPKGRTIRKVMGGGGGREKNKKKLMQGKMPRKNIHAKKKVKKKIHAEGRSNCDFFRKSEFQKSKICARHNMNLKNHFLLIERRQLEPCFSFKLQLVYLQHTLYTVL